MISKIWFAGFSVSAVLFLKSTFGKAFLTREILLHKGLPTLTVPNLDVILYSDNCHTAANLCALKSSGRNENAPQLVDLGVNSQTKLKPSPVSNITDCKESRRRFASQFRVRARCVKRKHAVKSRHNVKTKTFNGSVYCLSHLGRNGKAVFGIKGVKELAGKDDVTYFHFYPPVMCLWAFSRLQLPLPPTNVKQKIPLFSHFFLANPNDHNMKATFFRATQHLVHSMRPAFEKSPPFPHKTFPTHPHNSHVPLSVGA
ncbi:MAG: hypothetical protein QGD94_08435, partial [Planctomycetia bacterium]|nr:hypothetical protein [Planctomycetia bacterium]